MSSKCSCNYLKVLWERDIQTVLAGQLSGPVLTLRITRLHPPIPVKYVT